ncbi:MAG: 4-hydroxybenzoate 3-monooxygenase [Ilumatobacteraceae bacterium]|nr:4-hydroxybenzoate 3-monooxygenase [Ilumatobacteraceae bacterium]
MTISTSVAIIGAGPAGSLLSHLLHLADVDSVVVERSSRDHVLSRIRAGVLEWGSVEVLRSAGLGGRMDAEGHVHDSTALVWGGREPFHIDIDEHVGSHFMSYGQTKIQEDLYAAADGRGATIVFEASGVEVHDPSSQRPSVTFEIDGVAERIEADFVVGCDGYHGAARPAIPHTVLRTFEKEYPFGWLGIMSETPPLRDLVYANHPRGFALASQRSPVLSRYYVQCPLDDSVDDWSDDRFWSELTTRLGPTVGDQVVTGPSIEKSIAPLRSFVAEPMRYGNLFLAGDAAHIVPPTGAKGLNLAISDVYYLSRALTDHFVSGDDAYLDRYSEMALRRVWGAVRFSWWMTTLLHRFPDQTEFDQRAQEAELDYLASSAHAQASVAEQYAGLAFES